MLYYWHFQSAIGTVTIAEQNAKLITLQFGKIMPEIISNEKIIFYPHANDPTGNRPEKNDAGKPNIFHLYESELLAETRIQLVQYLAGQRFDFDLPLAPTGTPFQKSVWNALLSIPYGHTCSYKAIARSIGKPKACRAVGQANNRNPIAIIIPCHRVIGTNGSITGYGGGIRLKQRLLALERSSLKHYSP